MNASTLESDRPLRVLTPRLGERLAVVNIAIRALTSKGYAVIRQDLRLDDPKRRPLLTLRAGDESLRASLRSIVTTIESGVPVITGRYLDVDVCWPRWSAEPHRSTEA